MYTCVHGSLLPKYRGAAPIQWAVLNGEKEAGITTMQMDAGIDTGDMLLKRAVAVGENETAGELFDRLCAVGADLCAETIAQIQNGTLTPEKQNDALSCYAPMLSRDMAPIDWNKTAQQIHNHIRGLSPWPVAITTLEEKRLKIYASRMTELQAENAQPGEVVQERPLLVACGAGTVLELIELQADGSRRMTADVFVCGHAMKPGTRLGE